PTRASTVNPSPDPRTKASAPRRPSRGNRRANPRRRRTRPVHALSLPGPSDRLASQSRRDFLIYAAGVVAAGIGAWWLLPDRAKARLIPGGGRDRLDT